MRPLDTRRLPCALGLGVSHGDDLHLPRQLRRIPLGVPLLLLWMKPETKAWFGYA